MSRGSTVQRRKAAGGRPSLSLSLSLACCWVQVGRQVQNKVRGLVGMVHGTQAGMSQMFLVPGVWVRHGEPKGVFGELEETKSTKRITSHKAWWVQPRDKRCVSGLMVLHAT